jgi:alanyl-tRNA synthetase
VVPGELSSGIERLQAESRELKRQVKDLQGRLALHEAAALANAAEVHGAAKLVVDALEGWDAGGLKAIAMAIAARPGHLVLLVSVPAPSAVVIARAPDVPVDCAAVLEQLTMAFGGKGGGRADLAQGGGLQGEREELVRAARTLLITAV